VQCDCQIKGKLGSLSVRLEPEHVPQRTCRSADRLRHQVSAANIELHPATVAKQAAALLLLRTTDELRTRLHIVHTAAWIAWAAD
jgi:hypothetical protein